MMPIRPENRDRYPDDWKAVSKRIRDRAGNKCEQCGIENYAIIIRGFHGALPAWRYESDTVYENSRCAITGELLSGTCWDDFDPKNNSAVKVVLTVAHLDHRPENCADDNLRCLCQRCHNAYDALTRAAGIRSRKRASLVVSDMFSSEPAKDDA